MLITFFGLLLTLPPVEAAEVVAAPISSVTVHSGQARVVRTARLDLQGNVRTVQLPLLPATADPASVRLEAEGAAEVVHLSLTRVGGDRTRAPTDHDKQTLAELDQAIAAAVSEQEVFEGLAGVSGWKPSLPEETSRVDPRGWQRAVRFLEDFAARMQRQQRAVESRVQELRDRRARLLKGGPAADATAGTERWQVTATVRGRGPAKLRLGYLVRGASWVPSYEVRLDARGERATLALSGLVTQESGEDWSEANLLLSTAVPAAITTVPRLPSWRLGSADRFVPVSVAAVRHSPAAAGGQPASTPAMAHQSAAPGAVAVFVFDQTGMPLKGVRVQAGDSTRYTDGEGFCRLEGLRTGPLELRASAPALGTVVQRMTLGPQGGEAALVMEVRTQTEEVSVMEKAAPVSTTSAGVESGLGFEMPRAPRPATARAGSGLSALAVAPAATVVTAPAPGTAAALSGGNAVTFSALAPETITSGGQRKVALGSESWSVTVERMLAPGLGPDSFLVATVKSASRRPLPGGRATLFVGDDPAGSADLPPVAPGARFTLPLGVDRAVRMVRQVTVQTRQSGLFFWKRDIDRHRVTLEVTNPHARPLRLSIKDQLPVSGDDRVAVRLIASQPAAQVDRDTGTVFWRLSLAPGASTALTFEYELGRPSGELLSQEAP